MFPSHYGLILTHFLAMTYNGIDKKFPSHYGLILTEYLKENEKIDINTTMFPSHYGLILTYDIK